MSLMDEIRNTTGAGFDETEIIAYKAKLLLDEMLTEYEQDPEVWTVPNVLHYIAGQFGCYLEED